MQVSNLTEEQIKKIRREIGKAGKSSTAIILGLYDLEDIKDKSVLPDDWKDNEAKLKRIIEATR